ncbi:MAG TPA: thioredoxin [Phycisphaerae bacterium]|nr:thioredoxin [Phycisphaerae bacterium]
MGSQNVLELTDQNFEQEVVASKSAALVDFWAEWCMPCKMAAPTIEELADEYAGRLKVGKVDTDSNREVSMKFGITAIPTLILFKDGQMAKKFVGLQQKRDLKAAIDEILG